MWIYASRFANGSHLGSTILDFQSFLQRFLERCKEFSQALRRLACFLQLVSQSFVTSANVVIHHVSPLRFLLSSKAQH